MLPTSVTIYVLFNLNFKQMSIFFNWFNKKHSGDKAAAPETEQAVRPQADTLNTDRIKKALQKPEMSQSLQRDLQGLSISEKQSYALRSINYIQELLTRSETRPFAISNPEILAKIHEVIQRFQKIKDGLETQNIDGDGDELIPILILTDGVTPTIGDIYHTIYSSGGGDSRVTSIDGNTDPEFIANCQRDRINTRFKKVDWHFAKYESGK